MIVLRPQARPCDHSVACHRECVDVFLDALLHDLSYLGVHIVPERSLAVLRVEDPVQSLCYTVDRIAVSICCYVPFFSLELVLLVLKLDVLFELIPVELESGLLFYEPPGHLDLFRAVLEDGVVVELHDLRHCEERLVHHPVLDDGCSYRAVAGLVCRDHRDV